MSAQHERADVPGPVPSPDDVDAGTNEVNLPAHDSQSPQGSGGKVAMDFFGIEERLGAKPFLLMHNHSAADDARARQQACGERADLDRPAELALEGQMHPAEEDIEVQEQGKEQHQAQQKQPGDPATATAHGGARRYRTSRSRRFQRVREKNCVRLSHAAAVGAGSGA